MKASKSPSRPEPAKGALTTALARLPGWVWPVILAGLTAAQRAYAAAHTFWLSHDPGTVALMALHILEEGERPLFLYGFPYSGALLAYYTALLFGVFGVSIGVLLAAPISLAAGWAAATYLLFKELLGRRAGVAAALCVAVPGWITTWYSMAPDCSYSPMFVFGVTILWLCVRIALHQPEGRALWAHVLPLGLLSGLALWTHPMTLVYLLTGAVLLVPFLIRRRMAPRILLPFLVGGVLFLVALLPYTHTPSSTSTSMLASFHLQPSILWLNFQILMKGNMPTLLDWPGFTNPITRWLVRGIPVALFLLYILAYDARAPRGTRLRYLFPVLFAVLFLAFYLPHSLAANRVPRYVLPLWTLLLGGAFAATVVSHRGWVRRTALALLVLWVGFQTVSLVVVGASKKPGRDLLAAQYDHFVQRAIDLDLEGVTMVGDYKFANHSVSYNFIARDRVRFSATDADRYQPGADFVDAADRVAFAVTNAPLPILTATLDSMNVRYEVQEDDILPLVKSLQVDEGRVRCIPPEEMRAGVWNVLMGTGQDLLDRRRSSLVSGWASGGGGVLLDLARPRRVSGLLVGSIRPSGRGHPSGYLLEGSEEGETYTVLRDLPDGLPLVSTCGPRVYIGGGYSRLEIRFPPVEVRYLRFTPVSIYEGNTIWRFNELYVLEDLGEEAGASPRDWKTEAAEIRRYLQQEDVSFTACDRWLSARLREGFAGPEETAPAYPRYNPHYRVMNVEPGPGMGKRYVHPGPDMAIAVEAALAGEAEQVLRKAAGKVPDAVRRRDFSAYSVFTFDHDLKVPEPGLWWDGSVVLKE